MFVLNYFFYSFYTELFFPTFRVVHLARVHAGAGVAKNFPKNSVFPLSSVSVKYITIKFFAFMISLARYMLP